MSFLTPLYVLGALTVALPILFHLIQRRPRGEQTFSSLMFLSASPPRLTRRSRLDNLLLLLLRAAVLVLLALAFARPFIRSFLQQSETMPSRRILLLTDVSASMQRGDLWPQAVAAATSIAGDLDTHDQLALVTFDSKVQTRIPLPTTSPSELTHRTRVSQTLKSIQPGWNSTDLGAALVYALDLLQSAGSQEDGGAGDPGQIVLISDMQTGSDLRMLDGFSWPENVAVDVHALRTKLPSNAGMAKLKNQPSDEDKAEADDRTLRIRVINDDQSKAEQFYLAWSRDDGQPDEQDRYSVRVPPGQLRTVRVKSHPTSRSLVLSGDDHDFDNRLYIARPPAVEKALLYLGLDSDEPDSMYYFLKRAPLGTARYGVRVRATWPPAGLNNLRPQETPLIVATQPLSELDTDHLREYLNDGGRLLIVLNEENSSGDQMQVPIANLLNIETVSVSETEVDDYAMLGKIDFRHPILAPFADRRFNDFTKIRVWKHRTLGSDHERPWRTLIQFDDRQPALVERSVGEGKVWILTTSWQPSESQLALSTKFVPLLAGMFDEAQDVDESFDYPVGLPVPVRDARRTANITYPDGRTVTLNTAPFVLEDVNQPGVYSVVRDGESDEFAVNVALSESRIAPMDPVELEQRGVQLLDYASTAELKSRDRQLKDFELESNQQLWRWLIVAALCLLIVEVTVAGRLSRPRTSNPTENR